MHILRSYEHSLHNSVNLFRRDIEHCWSKTTAYEHIGSNGSPEGQCLVTSRLLQEVLNLQGLKNGLIVSVGRVSMNGCVVIPYHAWLEDEEGFIVDVTADQTPSISYSVIANQRSIIESLGIEYGLSIKSKPNLNIPSSIEEARFLELKSVYDSIKRLRTEA